MGENYQGFRVFQNWVGVNSDLAVRSQWVTKRSRVQLQRSPNCGEPPLSQVEVCKTFVIFVTGSQIPGNRLDLSCSATCPLAQISDTAFKKPETYNIDSGPSVQNFGTVSVSVSVSAINSGHRFRKLTGRRSSSESLLVFFYPLISQPTALL